MHCHNTENSFSDTMKSFEFLQMWLSQGSDTANMIL